MQNLVLGILLVIPVLLAALRWEQSKTRRRLGVLLSGVFQQLQDAATHDAIRGTASGRLRGHLLRFEFTSRALGDEAPAPWTEVKVTALHAPLELRMRQQRPEDERLVRKGHTVDLTLEDPDFDARYLLEGAPSAVVSRLLTPELRRRILALGLDELETRAEGFVLARQGWREDAADIESLVKLAAALAERIGPAILEASNAEAPEGHQEAPPAPTPDQTQPGATARTPFRQACVPPDSDATAVPPAQLVASHHADEFVALEATLERRKTAATRGELTFLVFIVLTGAATSLYFHLRQ